MGLGTMYGSGIMVWDWGWVLWYWTGAEYYMYRYTCTCSMYSTYIVDIHVHVHVYNVHTIHVHVQFYMYYSTCNCVLYVIMYYLIASSCCFSIFWAKSWCSFFKSNDSVMDDSSYLWRNQTKDSNISSWRQC